MDDVVEISGLENACRLCLTTEQTRSSIFGVPHVSVPFVEKIRSCLSIQVSSTDKVSTLVCTACIKNINHWHAYKDTCLQSQEKLQLWLTKQNCVIHPTVTVKEEPVDVEYTDDNAQILANDSNTLKNLTPNEKSMEVANESNLTPATNKVVQEIPEPHSKVNDRMHKDFSPIIQIKTEPIDTEDEDDCNIDIESVNSPQFLLNPMAVGIANTVNSDRIMEADSTQKFSIRRYGPRKKLRRGPHTHYRGVRLFKKKCVHCKINLHSKYSYTQHMSRYHGIGNNLAADDFPKPPSQPPVKRRRKLKLTQHEENVNEFDIEDQNEITNPEDAEYEKMITTDPLTPIQRNIIGQLKTFSCYSCKKTFFDRRHTLNHIRQHMPDLRPYTCIACLTEFSDRSMYKLHCGASFECAMKIALVVPKVGFEKYFTCNMCLRSFSNRQELLGHLSVHADKQTKQQTKSLRSPPKLKPINSSKATLGIDSSPSKKSITCTNGPYMNGDPAHNHMCDLCGMIYRYKPNVIKHREMCAALSDSVRTSFRCVHCQMTYLVYKKFYTHIFSDHKKREIICYTCNESYPTPETYLSHHETHRNLFNKGNEQQSNHDLSTGVDPMDTSEQQSSTGEKPFNCALCGENFATKIELTEHRNLHLKVKIYSCVICRSMFSSSGALEAHMKDHGIEDPTEQNANSSCIEYGRGNRSKNNLHNTSLSAKSDPGSGLNHCFECGKNFSNYANLKRHERNLHIKQKRRWSCDECKRRFKSAEAFEEHVRLDHGPQQNQLDNIVPAQQPQLSSPSGRPLMQCPKCPKTFTYQGNLILHCQNVHKENHFERAKATSYRASAPIARVPAPSRGHSCDICGKTFREEQSLKTHRGWHLRTNYKLKVNTVVKPPQTTVSTQGYTMTIANTPKPAKARKSFPNNPSQKQLNAITSLQCQVCDDRFPDVAELRKHLWDVHCARNKPEKSFTSELQCELCTNKFPDEESLENHMKWHSQNPILSSNTNSNSSNASANIEVNKKSFYCDICGKYYSNRKVFLRHKKLHKVLPASTMLNFQSLQSKRPFCTSCQKSFATDASLKRHKASPCHISFARSQSQTAPKKITTTAMVHHPPPEPMRLQTVKKEPGVDYVSQQSALSSKKKSVTCHICKTIFPNMSVLYHHKQLSHNKGHAGGREKSSIQQNIECVPLMSTEGMVCCNLCGKQFPGISNLKQHFAHKHKTKSATYPCYSPGCKLVFSSANSLKCHETTHSSMIYNCHLCDRHVFSKAAMTKHMLTMHKAIYQSGANKNTLWSETDLTTYSIKNCHNTACPKCKIKYPNLRALKIHYLKFHEKT